MEILMIVGGVEVLLLVLLRKMLIANDALLREIRLCTTDIATALALASEHRFREAGVAAKRWAERAKALQRRKRPPARDHAPGWRMAP